MTRLINGRNLLLAALLLLMAATRFSHAGTASLLPDASLAVFFLAALYYPRFWFFSILIAEAAAIDLIATQYLGVSDWCITPAYGFLLPTYAAMWGGGYFARRFSKDHWSGYLGLMSTAVGATVVAFLISNLGFYAFSGRYEEMGLAAYMSTISQYLAGYLGASLFYIAAGLALSAVAVGAKSQLPVRS